MRAVRSRVPGEMHELVLCGRELRSVLLCPIFGLPVDALECFAIAWRGRSYCQDGYVVDVANRFRILRLASLEEVRVVEQIEDWRVG